MLLPTITEYSIPAAEKRYADCARAMHIANAGDSDSSANQKLMDELLALNQELQVPTPAQFGIDENHFNQVLPTMAQEALASGSPGNNPRVPSSDEIIQLYKKLWA